ncbi:MAG: hypothetical protein RIR00_1898 [Pseudomonadota bacterium]
MSGLSRIFPAHAKLSPTSGLAPDCPRYPRLAVAQPAVRRTVLALTLTLALPFATAASPQSPPPAAAGEEIAVGPAARSGLAITVYNNGTVLVRDSRTLPLKAGLNRLAFREVASTIRPETASLRALGGGGFSLLEQNFDYDLLTPTALLEKYVGREISVIRSHPVTGAETSEKATVLATNDGTVLRYADRIETGVAGRLAFPNLPPNLRERPTLSISLNAAADGPQPAELLYLASNVSWKADYAATLDQDGKTMNLAGWVTLNNHSGTSYDNTRLQLIAGNLNTVAQPPRVKARAYLSDGAPMLAAAPMPSEEKLLEYHLYSFEQPTTLRDNQTKQLALLSAARVPVQKELILQQPGAFWLFQGANGNTQRGLKPAIYLNFANREPELGKPLPAGTLRVYQRDSQGGVQLVGEDAINHTARNETLALRLGEAFDLTADRSQTDYKTLGPRASQSSYRIEIRNGSRDPATLTLREPLQGDWTITTESAPHRKDNAGTASWQLKIPAEGKTTLEYSVVVKW